MLIKDALKIAGPLGYPSKMPGTSYGISAKACLVGAKLAQVPGSTCADCYALRGNYIFPSVIQAHKQRLKGIRHPLWTVAMVTLLTAAHKRGTGRNGPFYRGWHRWHDSGDLQSEEHLTKICAVAGLTPKIRHWLPTREVGIVTRYKARGGIIPPNLLIRVSATMIDGPATKVWPTTSGVHHRGKPLGRACPAPKQDNSCGKCRACWSSKVAHVSYHKH